MNNFPPTVTVLDSTVQLGQEISLLGRFSVDDIDPDSEVLMFRFRDSNTSPQSGYFTYQGGPWQQGLVLEISSADLADVTYHAGAIIASESITIEAFDGEFWSAPAAATFFSVVPNESQPIVVGTDLVVTALELISVDNFVSAFDPDGYPILEYMFIDGNNDPFGGFFSLFGTSMAQGDWFSITPDELPFLRYHGAQYGNTEPIAVIARDEAAWSDIKFLDATTNPNNFDPVVIANDIDVIIGERVPLSDMFAFSDADGNSLKSLEIRDLGVSGSSGFFEFNGFPITGGVPFTVQANEIDLVEYVAGAVFGTEQFSVQASDGQRVSDVEIALANTKEVPTVDAGRIRLFDSFEQERLIDLLDIDSGITPIAYEVIDLNAIPSSARIEVNGFALAAQEVHTISTVDFQQTFVVGGADDLGRSLDNFLVRVDNGFGKSAWSTLTVSTDPVNENALFGNGSGKWVFTTPTLELTYNFPTSIPGYYCTAGLDQCENHEAITDPDMREAVRAGLDSIATFADIRFTEIAPNTLSDIPFMLTDAGDEGTLAFSIGGPGIAGFPDVRGDIFGNSESPLLFDSEPGGVGFATWIHEILHSIGLEHPFAQPVDQAGSPPHLPAPLENNRYSIMSYTRVYNGGVEPITPQLYDVMAIQTLYGANPTYRAGNTQIKIDPNSIIPSTVYDSGGIDTLNFNQHVVGVQVNLQQGQFSSVGGQPDGVAIVWGTDIENARGGTGNDTLVGSELNNVLIGNIGDDTLQGLVGQDFLMGMEGNDTYIWGIGNGFDVINEDFGAGRDSIHIQLFNEYDTGDATLTDVFSFRRFGNDLRMDLDFGGDSRNNGMRITNMGWGRNRVETLRIFDVEGEQIGPDISLLSIFTGSTSSSQQFVLTSNTSNYGNLAVPLT